MRRITLFVSALLFCFLTCGTLAADAATPKPPPPKHHHAGKKKPKPAKPNVPHPHNDQGKAKAKDNSQQHSKAQAAKERAVTSTTHGGKTAGTSVVGAHHEPQALSDAQLRQARQLLLTAPAMIERLREARALLEKANHNYDGHRVKAIQQIEYAIAALPTDSAETVVHVKKAVRQLNIALEVN
ncbi:MAG: hypothetical protein WCB27_00500 [Thermoguttaceae bacterium]|jgi:hypothetical protein